MMLSRRASYLRPNVLGEGRERGILREASLSTDGLEGKGTSDAG